MSNTLDSCPKCGRVIGDHDRSGCETPSGQRFCLIHLHESKVFIYYVGNDPTQALHGLCFDAVESAEQYRNDNWYQHIYVAEVKITELDLEVVRDD